MALKKRRSKAAITCGQRNVFERAACDYLLQHGLELVDANYSCRFGEIDLVMRDGNSLVFVEVRFRKSSGFGGGAASVDSAKQRRLSRTARHYLQHHRFDGDCRFDVVDVSGHIEKEAPTVRQPGGEKPLFSLDWLTGKQSPRRADTAWDNLRFEWIKAAFMTQG